MLKIKGAYLLNFTRLVTWPDGSHKSENAPTVIGVMGSNELLELLETVLETHQAQSQPITLLGIDSLAQISECHVLYLSQTKEALLDDVIDMAADHAILTVSDIDEFTSRGGIIWLFPKNNRIGLDINRISERRAKLQINSRLLRLARNVLE